MATKSFNTRVRQKRDTSANWTSNNPVLLNGEIILVDTADGELRFKVGDGTKTYTQLPFTDEPLRNLIADKADTTAIPDSTSDLTNDSGFITSSDIPVTSVNSKTGDVSLTYSDVGAAASSHGTHVTYSTTNPAMDGTAAVGTATTVARSDHVHPVDTSRAPKSHASTSTTYGTGTSSNYGHVKLSDSTSSTSSTSGGIAATPKAVSDALTSAKTYADGISANDFTDTLKTKLEGIESGAQVNTVTSVNSMTGAVSLTYSDVGAAASSHGTHVTYSTTTPAMDGTAAVGTASTVARSDHVHPTDTSRAPTSHASSGTTYGTGTASNYGHLKLSDSTSSTSSTSGGIAATPKAVSDALTSAKSYTDTGLSGKSDTSHTHAVATSSANGFMSSEDKAALAQVYTDLGYETVGINTQSSDTLVTISGTNLVIQDSLREHVQANDDFIDYMLASFSSQVTELQSMVATQNATVSSLNTTISSLSTQVTELESRLTDLEDIHDGNTFIVTQTSSS